MSVVPEAAPPSHLGRRGSGVASKPVGGTASPMAWRDVLAVTGLFLLWALVLVWRYDAMPLQLWDESRNANNALEMAEHGRWLTPTFAGVIDHWNTKPPLLIWTTAALLKMRLPPLMAVRLTSWLAAAATTLTLWSVLRHGLKDALAGFAAGVLLLSAALYVGPHGARTGDYDALESAFVLGYLLAAWGALETGRASWLLLAATLMSLGVLTKGVAALLPLPGLCLYTVVRTRTAARLAVRGWTWAAAGLFILIVGGYYVGRELSDPGYLSAVAGNELGGRFLRVTENHRGSWTYYLHLLLTSVEPCVAVCGLGLLTAFGRSAVRRRLAWMAGAAAASILVVLSISSSKMSWYATPLVPLLSLIGGLGLTDGWRLISQRSPVWRLAARVVVVVTLGAGVGYVLWWSQSAASWRAFYPDPAQLRYGELFRAMQAQGRIGYVTVVDGGFANDAGFTAYDPMLTFYAGVYDRRGLQVRVVPSARDLPLDAWAASCDARAVTSLQRLYRLSSVNLTKGCVSAWVMASGV